MTQKKLRIGVIFGSRSGEYDVSLASAASVMANLDKSKYDVIPVGISRAGTWHFGMDPDALRALEEITQEQEHSLPDQAIALVGDPHMHDLSTYESGKSVGLGSLDLVFPVVHGPYGEDGTLQGLLEMADIPYVGCGVLGSALGMDKEKMKVIFRAIGLPTVEFLSCRRSQWEREPETVLAAVEQQIGYPCVVKPANLGSSVGVSKAEDHDTLVQALTLAAEYDSKIIVERWLNVRELCCAVLGNEEPYTSFIGEYVAEKDIFLDYNAKYVQPPFHFDVPADIPQALAEELFSMSRQAFLALDLSGLARVDFFLDRSDNCIYINEVNTMPGFTGTSVYPKLWIDSNLPWSQLLDRLVELALQRYQDRKRMRIR